MEKYKVNEKIKRNWLIKAIWNSKAYVDISIVQISFITGKLPEFMAVAYFLEKAGIVVIPATLATFAIFFYLGLMLFGYIWKKTGIYDAQQESMIHKNVYDNALYRAALKILGEKNERINKVKPR